MSEKKHTLNVRVSDSMLEKLRQFSSLSKITTSEVVRLAIDEYLSASGHNAKIPLTPEVIEFIVKELRTMADAEGKVRR